MKDSPSAQPAARRPPASGGADALHEGQELWRPGPARIEATWLHRYQDWLREHRGLDLPDYASLWRWSVGDLDAFWISILEFFEVAREGDDAPALASREMPGARWFPNLRLNYAENVFQAASHARPALLARAEDGDVQSVSWAQLRRDVGALAAWLQSHGIGPGDRVAAVLPNVPQTVVAFLACASIGAVWTACSPDMGVGVVLDRFRQVGPKVFLATDGYRYNGKPHDRAAVVGELLAQLPTIEHVVHVPGLDDAPPAAWGIGRSGAPGASDASDAPDASSATDRSNDAPGRSNSMPTRHAGRADPAPWADAIAHEAPLRFTRVPFDHPLWIVYSSGTTGLPKAMVHGHGGVVVTQLKTMRMQTDLHPGDRFLFLGSTGWIVWNMLVGGLMGGTVVVLCDGNPTFPKAETLWRFLGDARVTHFGCGAAFLTTCMKEGLAPGALADLSALRSISSTGSPLPLDAYAWVYRDVKADVWLASISGGTDVASGFIAGAAILPVTAGELQCPELGVAAFAFDDAGNTVVDQVGELVITEPMPSMPLEFLGDPDGARYRESYFEQYPGKWRHGDWIRFTRRGTSVIYGRSDATINRNGIRMGTAEIYRVVEELPEVLDSMVVDLEYLGRPSLLLLFVMLRDGASMDATLEARIREAVRTRASARHVPDRVIAVEDIPRTLTGKKMELPVRKLLLGAPAAKVASPDAMRNPESLAWYQALAETLNGP